MTQAECTLLIDCDPGIDDMMALAYAFAHPQVQVAALVASGGNVSTEQVGRNLRGVLELIQESVPVPAAAEVPWALGAENPLKQTLTTTEETHGDFGTGYAVLPGQSVPTEKNHDDGARLWVETARRYEGQLSGVVLGPCTNLARALELDPELPTRLASLHIMGGALNHRGNTMPTTEWNIHSDPEAAHQVFEAFDRPDAACYPVLCPLDATESNILTPELRQRLTAGKEDSPVLAALDDALQFYMEFHEGDGLGFIAHVHDPFVTAYAVNRLLQEQGDEGALVLGKEVETVIDVELDGKLTRGQTIADWLGRWGRTPNASALMTAEAATFFDHYIETVRSCYAHSH
ncbi:inosine-uridine preferring nucleoside hydrolase [Rothia aerolata]|uniref:Inosine-uridine preferring nucleoside hydrolase n=1 Tax=Rothia aerolata TaxID=1812262 RepID=A0A917IRH8_9MICC|nr:inosine-uridine preferring nucleoside hydrolase [Rothia aerolata]